MGRLKEFFHDEIEKPLRWELEQEQIHVAKQEWIQGIRTKETHSISEWEFLGKPLFKNRHNSSLNKNDSLNHIFENPIHDLDKLINETFKK